MSRLMAKPTKWSVAQRRLRSTWASAQSDQSLHSALNGWLRTQCFFMRTATTLIRLGGYPDWLESSLGAQISLLVLSWGGSNLFVWACFTMQPAWVMCDITELYLGIFNTCRLGTSFDSSLNVISHNTAFETDAGTPAHRQICKNKMREIPSSIQEDLLVPYRSSGWPRRL